MIDVPNGRLEHWLIGRPCDLLTDTQFKGIITNLEWISVNQTYYVNLIGIKLTTLSSVVISESKVQMARISSDVKI